MESIAVTPKNVESIAKLAPSIGWTPDQLANQLLAETLAEFADRNTASLQGFLGAICYPDRESAQRALDRVTQITDAQFNELAGAQIDAPGTVFASTKGGSFASCGLHPQSP